MGRRGPVSDPLSMHSATTTFQETDMTQLAYRINTGVALSLLWNRRGNEIVKDAGEKSASRSEQRPGAYAAAHRNDTFDRIAARGPLF
jgi:hypothetical protein